MWYNENISSKYSIFFHAKWINIWIYSRKITSEILNVIFSLQLKLELLFMGDKSYILNLNRRKKHERNRKIVEFRVRSHLFHPVIVKTNIVIKTLFSMITRCKKMQSYAKINKYPLYLYAGVTLSRYWDKMDTQIRTKSNSILIVTLSRHSWGHFVP